MLVGWDWASTTHDVTVVDDAGGIVDRWRPSPLRPAWTRRWPTWPATAGLSSCR